MEFRQLASFSEVAKQGHFTRAARELGIAQPAVSAHIAALERELRVRLIDRTNRRVRLTEAGMAFLSTARRILNEIERGRAEMLEFAGLARGRVVLSTLHSLSVTRLPNVLARFHERYPGIEVALLEGSVTDEMLESLQRGEIDLALAQLNARTSAPQYDVEELFRDELVAVVSTDHPLAKRKTIALAALREEAFVAYRSRLAFLDALVAAGGSEFPIRVDFETTDTLTMRALVSEGLGISVLPRVIVEGPGPPVAVLRLVPRLMRRIGLIAVRGRVQSAAATAFGRFVVERLRVER